MTEESKAIDPARWHEKVFSDGWIVGGAGNSDVTDKYTGMRLGKIGLASIEQVALAANSATRAQRKWQDTEPSRRAQILHRAAEQLDAHRGECIEWLMKETGGTRIKAEFELGLAVDILRYAEGMLSEPQGNVLPSHSGTLSIARRVPHGVVGVIAPFNVPLVLAIRAIAPALATGNAVVLKPDPQTAIVGGALIAQIFAAAGLPDGLLHVLPGGADVGEALCTDPRIGMIAFTGSTTAGRRVGELAGRHLKRVSLELGGKNAAIVFEDANLELSASAVAFGGYMHQGQVCMATGKVIVHESIVDAFTALLVEKAAGLAIARKAGDVGFGPLINARQVESVDLIVKDSISAGAVLRAGGRIDGLFYQPTVLSNVKPGMRVFSDEVFGPVLGVTTFRTDSDAISLANDTSFGLSASIFSNSAARAWRTAQQLQTGLVHINDQTIHDAPYVPFGGRGTSGNGSRVGGS